MTDNVEAGPQPETIALIAGAITNGNAEVYVSGGVERIEFPIADFVAWHTQAQAAAFTRLRAFAEELRDSGRLGEERSVTDMAKAGWRQFAVVADMMLGAMNDPSDVFGKRTGCDLVAVSAHDLAAVLEADPHAHRRPGTWDEDNGHRAGTACTLCAARERLRAALPTDNNTEEAGDVG